MKKGDKVKYTGLDLFLRDKITGEGLAGTIVDDDSIIRAVVEFDQEIPHGHTCEGRTSPKRGAYVLFRNLEKL